MPKFFLHICDGNGFVEDEEGAEWPDLAAARASAIEGLRDVLAGGLRGGTLDLASFIEIEDENHQLLETVTFAEAVQTRNDLPTRDPTDHDQ